MFLVRVPKAFHSPNPSRVAARTRVARTDEIWTACRLGSESSDVGETRPARRWLTSNMAETLEPKEEKDPSGEVCSTESVLPFFDCLRSCSTPLRFKAFSQSPYPCGCSCRHFQASPIIVVRSGFWGSQPGSSRIFPLEATSIRGSPARRGDSTALIVTPVTR